MWDSRCDWDKREDIRASCSEATITPFVLDALVICNAQGLQENERFLNNLLRFLNSFLNSAVIHGGVKCFQEIFLGMWRSMSLVSVYCGILTIGSLYQFVASQPYLNTFPICLKQMCCLFCFNALHEFQANVYRATH